MPTESHDKLALTVEDAFGVLDKLETAQLERLILVGGQAAAFWVARYEVAQPSALATKDIDVLLIEQDPRVAADCARVLGGQLTAVKGPRVPDVARVSVKMNGSELTIDFLRSLHGIENGDVSGTKLQIGDELNGKVFYVMHPVFVLASRLLNTFELPGRLTPENLDRVKYSVDAVRKYLIEQLSADSPPLDEVVQSIERIFDLAIGKPGLNAYDHNIDVFGAVPGPEDLSLCPPNFLEKRYPQLGDLLKRKRARHSRARLRSKVSGRTQNR